MTEPNRPRHALEDDTDNENVGLPLRGLAMILIAVAVLLIGWGVFSLSDKDSEETEQASQTQQTQGQQGQQGEQAKQDEKAPASEGEDPKRPDAEDAEKPKLEDERENPEGDRADGRPEGDAAAAEGGVKKEDTYVAVLNNSPIAGLAGDVANKMRDQQWNKTGVGNLPDESGVFPTSVVLYPKGNDAERQLAEQLAKDLGSRHASVTRLPTGPSTAWRCWRGSAPRVSLL